MRLFSLFACMLLAAPLSADEFHFGKDRVIHGVLLGQSAGMYKIRVEGGEIEVPTKSVIKVVTDNLTVEDIQKAEEASRERLKMANAERRERQKVARERQLAALKAAREQEAAARAAARSSNCHVRYRRSFRPVRTTSHRVRVYNPVTRTSERYYIRSR